MTALNENPFFIVGAPRSGTTLLRFILSSHPRLYVPEETGFIPFLGVKPQAQLSQQQVRETLTHIGELNRNWYALVEDTDTFYDTLPEKTLPFVLDALYRRIIAEYGAARWGDKTPTYVRYLPLLTQIFPSAQFIHMIRDGRDTTLSAQKKWGADRWYMDPYYLLKNWGLNVESGREAGRDLGPKRYLEIHYRTLVQRPQPEIEKICAFLDESFHPAMLEHTRLARDQIGPRGHVEVREEISTRSVQRWKKEMSPFHAKLADRIAGPTLSALGYERPPVAPMTMQEWSRYALLAAKYRLTSTAKGVLTALGLLTLNRGKRRRS